MLDVFLTVDVETWCNGWRDLDDRFPEAFRRHIHGNTSKGDFGLSFQLGLLGDHGLHGVFFVEPLFSMRFGQQPLADIVGLVHDGRQEVQLHLHTEWVDEAPEPLLDCSRGKRQHLRYFTEVEQAVLIRKGAELIGQAGAPDINTFRAGSFGLNRDTLRALESVGIPFDSSYNASVLGLDSGVEPGVTVVEPIECGGVHEYPITVFHDGTRSLRHAQISACTFQEMEGLLWQALAQERRSFVILAHSFDLLNRGKDRPDNVSVERFRKLCAFLEKHRDCFRMRGFQDLTPNPVQIQPAPLKSPLWRTGARMLSQAYRRTYR